jgi:hypothetical protein
MGYLEGFPGYLPKNRGYRSPYRLSPEIDRVMEADLQRIIDGAYCERECLVRFLAAVFPSGIKKTAIEGWEPEWHW